MTGMDSQEKIGGIIQREGSLRNHPRVEPVHIIPEDDRTQELSLKDFGLEVKGWAEKLVAPKESENPPLPKLS